ncbi:uncharacterized protein LOC127842685 isoform X2 [Dreissena polymorpha]|uniref:Uncharacterized protein n=1 Tax=Dreissena polymorpha TaxID=45954 RepID=A0A9D4ITU1_DREPO|nr:uncharacterized protein LOC127842685 isoform X2 [Dreissena polymorpha]KAH3787926.1 hypothetical protein DPMN_166055 [Dreissena polymorpha]
MAERILDTSQSQNNSIVNEEVDQTAPAVGSSNAVVSHSNHTEGSDDTAPVVRDSITVMSHINHNDVSNDASPVVLGSNAAVSLSNYNEVSNETASVDLAFNYVESHSNHIEVSNETATVVQGSTVDVSHNNHTEVSDEIADVFRHSTAVLNHNIYTETAHSQAGEAAHATEDSTNNCEEDGIISSSKVALVNKCPDNNETIQAGVSRILTNIMFMIGIMDIVKFISQIADNTLRADCDSNPDSIVIDPDISQQVDLTRFSNFKTTFHKISVNNYSLKDKLKRNTSFTSNEENQLHNDEANNKAEVNTKLKEVGTNQSTSTSQSNIEYPSQSQSASNGDGAIKVKEGVSNGANVENASLHEDISNADYTDERGNNQFTNNHYHTDDTIVSLNSNTGTVDLHQNNIPVGVYYEISLHFGNVLYPNDIEATEPRPNLDMTPSGNDDSDPDLDGDMPEDVDS